MTEVTLDEGKLKALYLKVVEEPNRNAVSKTGLIHCPECGEEILMIPTLRVMSVAIENHVNKHKERLKADSIKMHQTAIFVRLSLVSQVLQKSCHQQIS